MSTTRNNLSFVDFNKIHSLPSMEDIKASIDLVDIVDRYAQLKRRKPGEYWACCPIHEDKTPSFKVDAKRQSFYCFGCQAKGDVFDFIGAVEELDKRRTIERVREIAGDAKPIARPPRPRADEPNPAANRNRQLAREIWRGTLDLDNEALAYLEARGLRGSIPERLRWHFACPWELSHVGCLVAPVDDAMTGELVGVWRIRPMPGGKAERKGLGPMKGNCSRLYHAFGEPIGIAEGVEDAIAAHLLIGLPCWAVLSAGNMGAVVIPRHIPAVTIFADADQIGLDAAQRLAKRLRTEGREVRILKGIAAKDPNDILRAAL